MELLRSKPSEATWRSRVALLLVGVLALAAPLRAAAQDEGPSEYQLKAAFLVRFTKYVTWPKASFPKKKTPVEVWLVGADPFGKDLDAAFEDKDLDGRPYRITRIPTLEGARKRKDTPHVLYVGRLTEKQRTGLLALVADEPVLVVGEVKDLAIRGAHINFFVEEERVRFEINPEAAKARGLKIGSQLLRLARIVETPEKK